MTKETTTRKRHSTGNATNMLLQKQLDLHGEFQKYFGKRTMSIHEWAKELGVCWVTLAAFLNDSKIQMRSLRRIEEWLKKQKR